MTALLRKIFFKNYNYPLHHRITEVVAILFFFVYFFIVAFDIFPVVNAQDTGFATTLFIVVPVIAYIAADFASGFVHFLGDTFGTPETPYFGQSFIKAFREHHTDPKGITRHDFIEVNGSNCLICVPILACTFHFMPYSTSSFWLPVALFIVCFMLFILLTNQLHKWAHTDNPPTLVKELQRYNIVLSPAHHKVHHTEPFNKYYCITCGWLNPFLSRIRFFETTEKMLRSAAAAFGVK